MGIKVQGSELVVDIKKLQYPLPPAKNSEWWMTLLILVMGTTISIAGWLFYFKNNLTLSYNDARSHLNISRRVLDSLQPGIAQIGSVWLPLQHALQLPTIGNDFFYRTGLSGSLISMAAFVLTAGLIYKICRVLDVDRTGSLIATSAFLLNLNMVFIQATPMTESLLVFTLLFAVYYFAKWLRWSNILDLIVCGFATMLATLTRYDGWFLFMVITISVCGISLAKQGIRKAESHGILYATLAGFGVALWLVWNKMIFHSWLFFIYSEYSAKTQQDALSSLGRLLTKGNWGFSILTFFDAIMLNVGLPIFILGIAGISAYMIGKEDMVKKLTMIALVSPIAFNILSLYLGQSVIHLPNLPPNAWFNVRYGLLALPALVVGMGLLVRNRKVAAVMCGLIIAANAWWMATTNNIVTVQDGVRGSSGYFLDDVGQWVNENASDGLILVAASSHDALIFVSGLPLKNFITEGIEKQWNESLGDPTKHAKYVIMHDGDLVYDKLHGNPNFEDNYALVFQGDFTNVYKRKADL